MHRYALEELAWAMTREREEEARRLHLAAEAADGQRSRLARKLVLAGLCLDEQAGESVLLGRAGQR